MTRPLILGLPKGRILDETAQVFAKAGYDLSPLFADSRKLVFECGPLRVLVLRNSDIATYVAYGAADMASSAATSSPRKAATCTSRSISASVAAA